MTMHQLPDDNVFFDSNGALTERVRIGDQDLVVHYDDVPDKDITTRYGIRVTTPLRTVIDIALDCEPGELERILADALRRRLITPAEAWERLSEPDMRARPGALLVGKVLTKLLR